MVLTNTLEHTIFVPPDEEPIFVHEAFELDQLKFPVIQIIMLVPGVEPDFIGTKLVDLGTLELLSHIF